MEAVKNDLNEIITTAVTESFQVSTNENDKVESESVSDHQTQTISNSTVNSMKQSLSSFFGSVTDALMMTQIDEEAEAVLITSDDTIVLTGFSKHLAELQSNDETYLQEPTKTTELAEKYR